MLLIELAYDFLKFSMTSPEAIRILKTGFILLICFAQSCTSADSKIAGEINEKLMSANPSARATVRNGIVTLTGTCPDQSCKNVCETAARETEGVDRVINEIVVNQPPPPQTTESGGSDSAARQK